MLDRTPAGVPGPAADASSPWMSTRGRIVAEHKAMKGRRGAEFWPEVRGDTLPARGAHRPRRDPGSVDAAARWPPRKTLAESSGTVRSATVEDRGGTGVSESGCAR